MEEYKSNSYRSKAEESKDLKKIASGKIKKKSEMEKIAGMFVEEDASSIKSYVVMDVLIPTIKKTILDVVEMLLFGKSGSSSRPFSSSSISNTSRTPYRSFYDDRRGSRTVTTRYQYDDIVLETRGEAEKVLYTMDKLISSYGLVSVADLYELVNVTGNYTDNHYGWTDLGLADVVRARGGGYLLNLPKPIRIGG